jgi:23S rRNA pseudouridine1911/1915/1917 synthase
VEAPALAAALRSFTRQALHAWRVDLTHPISRQRLVVTAPLPRDMAELMKIAGLHTDAL